MTDNGIKLLVALALFIAALGITLAFAQDEDPPRRAAVIVDQQERPGRQPGASGESRQSSQSCVDETNNGSSFRLCVAPTTVRPDQPVKIEARASLGPECGPVSVDFGDDTNSIALSERLSTLRHAYERPGPYVVRLVAGACDPGVRLRVTVTP